MFLINGNLNNQIPVTDRALHYGDGLFETIAVIDGKPIFWDEHISRLRKGCYRLDIPSPDKNVLRSEAEALLKADASTSLDKVLKIIVTRGSGGRGYSAPHVVTPTRILGLYPWPDYPTDASIQGVDALLCKNRMGDNPQLAGLKHLNRLEQILACQEFDKKLHPEGLVCDQNRFIISGTMSNLFLIHNKKLYTPSLDGCGVAGVIRDKMFEIANSLKIACKIAYIDLDQLKGADEVFLTNSIIGIWPVRKIEKIDSKNKFTLVSSYHRRELITVFQDYLKQLYS